MSASREKQNRQEFTTSDRADSKSFQKTKQNQKEKRSSLLYKTIGVLFLIALIASVVWRSNILAKTATAATIDGEKYSAAEVSFHYQNAYYGFMNQWSYMVSYLGLNPQAPLAGQTINESAASILGVEAGKSWHDYFLDQALNQMTMVQKGLEAAEAEGFEYPAGVQAQYEDSMESLEKSAVTNGVSVDQLLKGNFGSTMTKSVYGEQLLNTLKFSAYYTAYSDQLTYTDSEINAAYKEATSNYDKVSYESVIFSGTAATSKDEDGKPVEPTEEETAAAMKAAKEKAEALLASYKAGGKLESLADAADATYAGNDHTAFSGDAVSNWLFDDARKNGDSTVLENGNSYYVLVFHNRFREEYPTIDVRHILIQPEAGTLGEGDEGYADEQTKLKAEARAHADELLAQWQAGDATEDSFAELAMKESSDGSKYTGGLYTQVTQGMMVAEFNDWCFDSARKSGDTGVVDTQFGSHVMYFVGTDLPCWQAQVVADLKAKDADAWEKDLAKDVSAELNSFGAKFVG